MRKCISFIALILIIIGALNWGLWGFFQFDAVAYFSGGNTVMASRVAYAIIGLAGLWSLSFLCRCCKSHQNCCKCCCKDKSGKSGSCR